MGGKHHGYSRTAEYKIWKGIKNRCNNPKSVGWKNYGGRGITMHPDLEASFLAFLAEVGPRPSPLQSMERKDNNKGYEPGNLIWATRAVQAVNRRNNHLLTVGDRTQTISQWAKETGLTQCAIRMRIKRGMGAAEAVKPEPINRKLPPHSKAVEVNGRTKTVKAWARETGIPASTLRHRLKTGWPMERLLEVPVSKSEVPRTVVGQFKQQA